ncbi:hypothetical protein BH11GEM2_BH11GEM2_40750 [soil metagenome]
MRNSTVVLLCLVLAGFTPASARAQFKAPGPVIFELATDKLSPLSDDVLKAARDYLVAKPDITLMRIEGHTDGNGNASDSQALSEKRAMAVTRWLVGAGVDCHRLIAVGFGGSKPVAANDTPENRAANVRIAFIPAALRGRAIGGMPVDAGGQVAGDSCQ